MHFWLTRIVSRAFPGIFLPIGIVFGSIGVLLESFLSDRHTPTLKSVKEKREERQLNEEIEGNSIKSHSFVPKTVFEKNLSPSLKEVDNLYKN